MKIKVTYFPTHAEVCIQDAVGINQHVFVFDKIPKVEVKAFMSGWRTCQSVMNGLVQSLPQSEEWANKL